MKRAKKVKKADLKKIKGGVAEKRDREGSLSCTGRGWGNIENVLEEK